MGGGGGDGCGGGERAVLRRGGKVIVEEGEIMWSWEGEEAMSVEERRETEGENERGGVVRREVAGQGGRDETS